MHIKDLSGKNVCILGYGREGYAMAQALQTHAKNVTITIADKNESLMVPSPLGRQTGSGWLKNLERFDTVIKSPGVPPLSEFSSIREKLTTPTQIFFDSIADSGARVIGVTGSKGKSTTSTLIYEMLKAGGKDAHLVGNIGEPAISHIEDARPGTIFVHELSSYQLMDLRTSPEVAVITAFFPEHLDYHGSLEAYLEAKMNIARHQKKSDTVIYHADFAETKHIASASAAKRISFTAKDAPTTEILLKGEHNLGNAAGAWIAAKHFGIPKEIAIDVLKKFRGLHHRLESLGIVGGIEWVNDSISTTPESAVAALDALGPRVSVIILGGQDRGYDFTPLAKKIASMPSIRMAILLPDSGIVIGKAIEHAGARVILSEAKDLEEAVITARKAALDPAPAADITPIVVMSPAAPSYGRFKNFEERGALFAKVVREGSTEMTKIKKSDIMM